MIFHVRVHLNIQKHSQRDSDIISKEIKKLLQKQVSTKCDINDENYFSSLFVRPKKIVHSEQFSI